jgi:hypothetical protein
MLTLLRLSLLASVLSSSVALADGPAVAGSTPPAAPSALHRPSLELNVLWPFFPGGITELRFLAPVSRAHEDTMRGAIVVGVYSDFASRVVRDETYGKVSNLSAKLGWREYFVGGLHAEAAVNLGWRHEAMRPPNNETFDGFQIRLWTHVGYEHQFSSRFYANARGALGIHIYRTGPYADLEKVLVGGGDLNLGVRF